jgi:hypothetical protein
MHANQMIRRPKIEARPRFAAGLFRLKLRYLEGCLAMIMSLILA